MFGVRGLGFGDKVLGFGVQGSESGVQGSGFRVLKFFEQRRILLARKAHAVPRDVVLKILMA